MRTSLLVLGVCLGMGLATGAHAQVREFGLGSTVDRGVPGKPRPAEPASTDAPAEAKPAALQHKVAQMLLVTLQGGPAPDGSDLDLLKKYPVGGVVIPSVLRPTTATGYISTLRALSPVAPLFIATDIYALPRKSNQEVIGFFSELPTPLALAAGGDPVGVVRYAEVLADYLSGMGFNLHLGPSLVLAPNLPEARASLSCLGADPQFAAAAGEAICAGLSPAGILAMPMGFPGGGYNRTGDQPAVLLTPGPLLAERDLAPYARAIQAGARLVNVGTTLVPTIDPERGPACLSPAVIQGILRKTLAFDGIVVAGPIDSPDVTRGLDPAEAAIQAVEAGADMLYFSLPGQQAQRCADAVALAVKQGRIAESVIDTAWQRILAEKDACGLRAVQPPRDSTADKLEKTRKVPRATYELERRGITVVRNRDNILPLTREGSLPLGVTGVVGAEALQKALEKPLKYVSLQVIPTAKHLDTIEDFEIDRLTRHAQGVKTAVCVLTGALRDRSGPRLIQAIQGAGMKAIVVLIGYPSDLTPYADADALLLAFCDPANSDQTMRAVADALTGQAPVVVENAVRPFETVVGRVDPYDVNDVVRTPAGRLPLSLGEEFPAGFGVTYDLGKALKKTRWDFGDDQKSSDPRAEHAYEAPGNYTVTLTVTDRLGQESTGSFTVVVR